MIRIRVFIHVIIMLLKLRFNYCIRFVIERKQQTSNGKRSLRGDLEKREWILRINMCFIGLERWAIRASIKRYRHNPNYSNRINIKMCGNFTSAHKWYSKKKRSSNDSSCDAKHWENQQHTLQLSYWKMFTHSKKRGNSVKHMNAQQKCEIESSFRWIWMNWMDQSELISTIYFC